MFVSDVSDFKFVGKVKPAFFIAKEEVVRSSANKLSCTPQLTNLNSGKQQFISSMIFEGKPTYPNWADQDIRGRDGISCSVFIANGRYEYLLEMHKAMMPHRYSKLILLVESKQEIIDFQDYVQKNLLSEYHEKPGVIFQSFRRSTTDREPGYIMHYICPLCGVIPFNSWHLSTGFLIEDGNVQKAAAQCCGGKNPLYGKTLLLSLLGTKFPLN